MSVSRYAETKSANPIEATPRWPSGVLRHALSAETIIPTPNHEIIFGAFKASRTAGKVN
jgi:hypothetical protein